MQELGECPPSLDELLAPMLPYDATRSDGSNLPFDVPGGPFAECAERTVNHTPSLKAARAQAAQSKRIGPRISFAFRTSCSEHPGGAELLCCGRRRTMGAEVRSCPRPTQGTWLRAFAQSKSADFEMARQSDSEMLALCLMRPCRRFIHGTQDRPSRRERGLSHPRGYSLKRRFDR